MEKQEFLKQQFITLRDEIAAIKSRSFWIVLLGLFGVPTLAYFASDPDAQKHISLLVPFFVLVIILAFLAEQNALMRAGRYIREQIEKNSGFSPGWEAWLETHRDLRLMDRHFLACFIIVFFVYYFMTIGMALVRLYSSLESGSEPSAQAWLYGSVVTYAIGAVWAVSTLVHHWKSCVGTSPRTDQD